MTLKTIMCSHNKLLHRKRSQAAPLFKGTLRASNVCDDWCFSTTKESSKKPCRFTD